MPCKTSHLKHFMKLAEARLCFEAVYCSAGLHQTKIKLVEVTDFLKNEIVEDKIALAIVNWLERYEATNQFLADLPPLCKLAIKKGKGESEFEKSIWQALEKQVPAGQIVTYGKLAEMANKSLKEGEGSRYARAVGQIMRLNPFCLLRPCHRVVPSSYNRKRPASAMSNDENDKQNRVSFGAYGSVPDSAIKRALLEYELERDFFKS